MPSSTDRRLAPFADVGLRVGSGAEVVGWFEVTGDAVTWRPRPRFVGRGAPTITVRWPDVAEIATTPGSSGVGRRLAAVDVFSVRVRDAAASPPS